MSTTLAQILDRFKAVLIAHVPPGTGVYVDRTDAQSREETPCVNLLAEGGTSEPWDGMDDHTGEIELRLAVRDDSPTAVAEALHATFHGPLTTDPQLLVLVDSIRLVAESFDRQEADITSLIKAVRYRVRYLIPSTTL